MPYKTIVLGLIEQQPELHEHLRKSRTMLRAMDLLAIELKERHEALKEQFSRSQGGHPSEPDLQLSAGDGGRGTGGAPGFRLAPERKRDVFARRGDDPYTPSHAERVRASRGQSLLPMFDAAGPPGAVRPGQPNRAPETTRPPPAEATRPQTPHPALPRLSSPAAGKTKARDIIAAIRTLQSIERDGRPASNDERDILARFGGFGAVALSLFPDPVLLKEAAGSQIRGISRRRLANAGR